MSWDIHGMPLKPGHCEVHPQVAEPWPCSICQQESAAARQWAEDHDRPVMTDVDQELRRVDHVLEGFIRGELRRDELYALEPWRLAKMARIAHRVGVMTREESDEVHRIVRTGIRPVRVPPKFRRKST